MNGERSALDSSHFESKAAEEKWDRALERVGRLPLHEDAAAGAAS